MSQPTTPTTPRGPSRSRGGCNECRRLHKKCDETKPVCDACRQAGKECSYVRQLSWGGRPFGRSRFGQHVEQGNIRIEDEVGAASRSFIYTQSDAPPRDPSSTELTGQQQLLSLPITPQLFPGLSNQCSMLLHHFATTFVPTMSLDVQTQSDTCATLLPICVDQQFGRIILSAMFCVSSTHRRSLGLNVDPLEASRWRDLCLRRTQTVVATLSGPAAEVLAWTAFLLSVGDIIDENQVSNSWRLHMGGALAALQNSGAMASPQREPPSQIIRLCTSLQLLSSLNGTLVTASEILSSPTIIKDGHSDYIDEIHGFSTNLRMTFEEISFLAKAKAALDHLVAARLPYDHDLGPLYDVLHLRSTRLTAQIHHMIRYPVVKISPNLRTTTATPIRREFLLVNELYHHVALLQVYSRIDNLLPSSDLIQHALANALNCIQRVTLTGEACPGVVLIPPCFTLGCVALDSGERALITSLLARFRSVYGRGNAQRIINCLQDIWVARDSARPQGIELSWVSLIDDRQLDLPLW